MVGRIDRRVQQLLLARLELGFAQQCQHAQHAVKRRADRMAHVGEEFALHLAGAQRLFARIVQPVGHGFHGAPALVELAHAAQCEKAEQSDHRGEKRRQRQAHAVVLRQRVVARRHLLGDAVSAGQQHLVDRFVECLEVGQQRLHRCAAERRLRARAEVQVAAVDEVAQRAQRRAVLGVVGQNALRAVGLQQPDAADEDVVAQLQRIACTRRVGGGLAPAFAQAQVLGLELEQIEHQVVVLALHRLPEQRKLARLHEERGHQSQDQHRAGDDEPARQRRGRDRWRPAAVGLGWRRQRRRWARYSTSIVFSCHTERL